MGWGDDAIIFGSHGRVLARKGYMTMIRAARIALDNAPADLAHRMHFAVIGDMPADHPRDHLAECRALVEALSMGRQFAFLGYRKDVRPYIADYDVCVVPSSFAEPFGLAVTEGFAFRVPVIASAVGGIPEIVRAGETGMLVPPDDPDALAAAMLVYAQNKGLRQRHGEAGRAYVERCHDARDYAARIQRHVFAACQTEAIPACPSPLKPLA